MLSKEQKYLSDLSEKACGRKTDIPKSKQCEHSSLLMSLALDKEQCFFDPTLSEDERQAKFEEIAKLVEKVRTECKC